MYSDYDYEDELRDIEDMRHEEIYRELRRANSPLRMHGETDPVAILIVLLMVLGGIFSLFVGC